MRKVIITLTVLLPCFAIAQQNTEAIKKRMMDSIKSVYLDAYALKYPGIRQVTISHEVVMPGKINTELNGKSLFDGRYWVSKTNANINLPAYRWNKNSIVASIGATHNSFHLNNIKNYNSQFGILPQETSKTTVTTSLSYVRNDSLFGKPVIFNVGATALFNADFSRQRFLYTAVIMFELKRTTTSSLSIGAVFIKDPSATVPFAPLISYWHKISSLEAELFVNAPYRIALRKNLKRNIPLLLLQS